MTGGDSPLDTHLQTANERFDLLAKATHDAVWDWDLEASLVWWNEGARAMFGWTSEAIEPGPESWFNRIHPEDKEQILQSIHNVIDRGGTNWSAEYRFRRADGSYAHVYDRGYTIHQRGKPVRMLGTMQDISERIRLQQLQKEIEEERRIALEGAELGIWILYPATRQVKWDERCQELFGFRPGSHIDYASVTQCIHPADRLLVEEAIEHAIDPLIRAAYRLEYRTIGPEDGQLRWIRAKGKAFFHPDGTIYRLAGTVQDITEEKRRSAAFRNSEKLFKTAFDNASVGVVILDMQSRIQVVNKAFADLVGYTPEELQHRHFSEITHPDDIADNVTAVQRILGGGSSSYMFDKRYLRKDGSVVWGRVHSALVRGEDGLPESFVSITQDITEEVLFKAEQQKLVQMVETSADCMALADLEGNIVYINEVGGQLTGLDRADMLGKNWAHFYRSDESIGKVKQVIARLIENGRWSGASAIRHVQTGEEIPCFLNTVRIDDPTTGKPLALAATIRDLRPERAAQQALLDSENLFRNITTASSAALWITDDKLGITYVNQRWIDWTGQPLERQLGAGWLSFVVAEDRQRAADTFLGDFASRRFHQSQFRIFHPDGTIRWVVCTGNPHYTTDGRFTGYIGAILDVTERVEFEQKLRASEERFRTMIELAPVAMLVFRGDDMVFETVNRTMLAILDKTPAIIGKPLLEGLPEVKGQPIVDIIDQVYQTGEAYYGWDTPIYLHRNGRPEEGYFNFVYTPIREGDRITGVLEVATEVTDQVKARTALIESEQRFRNLVLDNPTGTVVYTGREMRVELINEPMLRIWGKDPSVKGKTLHEAMPELVGQPFLALLQRVYDTGELYHSEEGAADIVVNGQLQTFWFNFSYNPLYDAEGKIYGIINTATDVTRLVKARQQLKEAEEGLRSAVEVAQLGTWQINPLSQEAQFSDRLKEWLGYNPDETMTLADALGCMPDHSQFATAIQQSIQWQQTGCFDVEYTVVNAKTGQQRFLHSQGKSFFNEQGQCYLVVGTSQDVTVQRRTEQELERQVQLRTEQLQQANADLQQSNQELEQYAYVASHDLQEPLRKIQVFSELLHGMDDMPTEGKSALTKVISSAERMSRLIKDLLQFSRLLKAEKRMHVTDLNGIVQQVVVDFELLVQEKNARLSVGPLPELEAVSLQMNQLFYNLLNNALKFTKPAVAPVILIQARLLSADEVAQHGLLYPELTYYDITVTDNGIGFNPAYAERIFDVFKRLHTRQIYPGSGIGLSLCRKIVQNHQGLIYAQSEEDKGTTFHVILPRTQRIEEI